MIAETMIADVLLWKHLLLMGTRMTNKQGTNSEGLPYIATGISVIRVFFLSCLLLWKCFKIDEHSWETSTVRQMFQQLLSHCKVPSTEHSPTHGRQHSEWTGQQLWLEQTFQWWSPWRSRHGSKRPRSWADGNLITILCLLSCQLPWTGRRRWASCYPWG